MPAPRRAWSRRARARPTLSLPAAARARTAPVPPARRAELIGVGAVDHERRVQVAVAGVAPAAGSAAGGGRRSRGLPRPPPAGARPGRRCPPRPCRRAAPRPRARRPARQRQSSRIAPRSWGRGCVCAPSLSTSISSARMRCASAVEPSASAISMNAPGLGTEGSGAASSAPSSRYSIAAGDDPVGEHGSAAPRTRRGASA